MKVNVTEKAWQVLDIFPKIKKIPQQYQNKTIHTGKQKSMFNPMGEEEEFEVELYV